MTDSPYRSIRWTTRLCRAFDFDPKHWPQTLRTRMSQHRATGAMEIPGNTVVHKSNERQTEVFGAMTFTNVPPAAVGP